MKTVDFLDAVKARHRLASDYQLCKFLGWTTSRVSLYRTTPRELDDDACIQIAKALDMPAPYVMACIAAARAKSAESKHAWEKAAKLLKTGSAAVILAAALLLSQNAPGSSRLQQSAVKSTSYTLCAARRALARFARGRRRRRVLRNVTADRATPPEVGNAPLGG